MSRALVDPLQGLIKQASTSLPSATGHTEAYARRMHADGPAVIVADVSGSMDSAAWGGKRKIDILRAAVAEIMSGFPSPRLIAFSGGVLDIERLPEPSGGTALHLALTYATRYRPGSTLVISDGQPDDETKALASAEALPGRIDTLYVGPDADKAAINFMARLARLGCGQSSRADLARAQPQLASTMRQLLLSSR